MQKLILDTSMSVLLALRWLLSLLSEQYSVATRSEPRPISRSAPTLEALEARYAPARDLWFVGAVDASWSDQMSWVDSGGATHAPETGDTLYLNPSAGPKGMATPTNNKSKADLAVVVDNVFVDPSYTEDINLVSNLTARSNFWYMPTQGKIESAAGPGPNDWFDIKVDPLLGNGNVIIGGNADIKADLVFAQNVAASFSDNFEKHLRGTVENQGTMTWYDGDISLYKSVSNGGTFDIQADKHLKAGAGGFTINNAGTVKKSAGVGVTTIAPEFVNVLMFKIESGTMKFTGVAGQAIQNNATTILMPGTTLDMNGGTYRVLAGALYGGGAEFRGTLNMEGGTLYLQAANGGTATFVIKGNYVQMGNATMYVLAKLGANSALDVQQLNGAGGNVNLGGKLHFNVDPASLPLATPAGGVAFLKYVTRTANSNFGPLLYNFPGPNQWLAGGALHSFLAPQFNGANTEYRMFIS